MTLRDAFFYDIASSLRRYKGELARSLLADSDYVKWLGNSHDMSVVRSALVNANVPSAAVERVVAGFLVAYTAKIMAILDGSTSIANIGQVDIVDAESRLSIGGGLLDEFMEKALNEWRLVNDSGSQDRK